MIVHALAWGPTWCSENEKDFAFGNHFDHIEYRKGNFLCWDSVVSFLLA